MASSPPMKVPVKRLGELLQEQQEPFHLDLYLLERGYSKKSLNLEGRSCCCPGNSGKDLKRLGSYGLKRRKGIQHGSKIVRSVLNKLVSVKDNRKKLNCDSRAYEDGRSSVSEVGGKNHQVVELDRFSYASSMTVFESCSESDTEEESPSSSQQNPLASSSAVTFQAFKLCNLRDQEAATDRPRQWECIEDSKQHSPVSVLEELPSDECSPVHNQTRFCSRTNKGEILSTSSFNLPKKVIEDSIFSASMWELLVEKQGCIGATEQQELLGTASSSSQYLKNKRVLQQTKQLLFDCVREVVETHGRKGRRRHVHEFLGAEELGKILCEQICLWGKQSGNVTNITQLINSDFWDSAEEWSDFQPNVREIGMEIGDAILEDIMNEIKTDMI